jgi:hypothetical protein
MKRRRREVFGAFFGLVVTAGLHAGVFGGMWLLRTSAEAKPQLPGTFVDAQLVRFGKPRDLKFLPHKQSEVKPPPEAIKIAKSDQALPKPPEEKKEKPPEVDPLKKTHADLFKHLADQPEGAQESNEGSLTGSRAGTATEAKGDPYILQLMDQIGTAWTVPTTIPQEKLRNLSARACLDIADDGTLRGHQIRESSGNSQFDSSLAATLSTTKKLPPPPDRYRGKRLCPIFVAPQ